MPSFNEMKKEELTELLDSLNKKYNEYVDQKLKLNMSRGNPSPKQLDLSIGMLEFSASDPIYKAADGTDCRNYNALLVDGIPEAKALFAEIMEVQPSEVIVGNSSSLNLMFDSVSRAMTHGVYGSSIPWSKLPKVKFLCPSPGYDRHFAVAEFFGFELVTIEMKNDGPDMDKVEELVASDDLIKGIWCVPKYSNPTGITFSDEVVDRLAKMKTKAQDFRIFWDNAYTVHHLSDNHDNLKNIMDACKSYGTQDRVFIFASFAKISFAGAGIAAMAASENNTKFIKKQMSIQTIGPDKLNQLRHVKFFKDKAGVLEHMKKHAAILKPKFDIVQEILEKELGGKGIATWSKPNGGYFVSFNTLPGCAAEVVKMAEVAGVVMTKAGATFPYGKDPEDKNIRIAPTFPPLDELKKAMEMFCVCVQIASIKKLV